MKQCWARCLGNCSEMSGEHVVSKGLFERLVVIAGKPFTKGDTKQIGLKGIVRNVLCRKHNNALSEVDKAGIRAFLAVLKAERENGELQADSKANNAPMLIELDGRMIERWFLKTAINLFQWKHGLKWSDGSACDSPPRQLVEAVYGKVSLVTPMGLYVTGSFVDGHQLSFPDRMIVYTPFCVDGDKHCGCEFDFQGFHFLIWFSEREQPYAEFSRRLCDARMVTADGRTTHEFRFRW